MLGDYANWRGFSGRAHGHNAERQTGLSARRKKVGLDYSQHDEHYGLAHVGEREIAEYEEHIREKEMKL